MRISVCLEQARHFLPNPSRLLVLRNALDTSRYTAIR